MNLVAIMKKNLPQSWRSKLNVIRETRALNQLSRNLRNYTPFELRASQGQPRSNAIVVVPTDPFSLVGARGDDAMISTAAFMARRQIEDREIFIVTASPEADHIANSEGYVPLNIWRSPAYVSDLSEALERVRPSAMVVVGGDVIDGHYGPLISAKLLASAEVAARNQIPTTLLGFSFNKSPAPELRRFLDELHPGVQLNLRDAISLQRFKSFTSAKGELVADSAFLLPPDPSQIIVKEITNWVNEQRHHGRKVIGFNLHPFLFRGANASTLSSIFENISSSLLNIASRRHVSFLLFPHDDRGEHGDDISLKPIYNRIHDQLGDRAYYLSGRFNAATLKAVASRLDGVVAGRMHLAIAALGSNVPVLSITYQDKFEGLYEHFRLPQWPLLDPGMLVEGESFVAQVTRFIDELETLQKIIVGESPNVRRLSGLNYRIFAEQQD
ncbi:polysaccharide pyruvyl transferase family protein [Rhizobium sp. RU36D]|uniref:polysaccharide pyruvyl transferase family protein n=1 Tax=Rhizobium sp. RU36D TaxID=1907415 RepID=UPI0009D83356|nr:polysaccharide pyruvyl transferase family protein [Rhizobium sp. RU36D]SMD20166.1 Polysaccharide pyruvyl transferase family protein WcaK [Rhizobium sp. RU36D]